MKIRGYDPVWMIQTIDNSGEIQDEIVDMSSTLNLLRDTILKTKVIKSRQQDEQYCYYNYIDDRDANQPGSEWQHQDCITIAVDGADLIFDLLKDGRIGGVEIIYSAQNVKDFKKSNH